MSYKKVIVEDPPIIVNPGLAEQVGLKQALLLTVMASLIKREGVIDEAGTRWARLTVAQIRNELPFLSTSTIARLLRKLVEDEYVQVSETANVFDKARMYSLGGGLV